jgi:signal transduction histidine kinase
MRGAEISRLTRIAQAHLTGARLPVEGITVGSPEEMLFRVQSIPAGSEITAALPGGPSIRSTLPPQLRSAHLAIVLVSGLFFFLVNLLVFCPRVGRDSSTRAFYWCTLLCGMAVLLGGPYFPRGAIWRDSLRDLLWIASLILLPVLFVELSLTFPRRHEILDRRPRILLPLWFASVLLIGWEAVAYLRYFLGPGPAAWGAIATPRMIAQVFLVLLVAAACLILFARSRRLILHSERQQMRWLLWGFTIGVAPYVFLRTLPRIFGLHDLFDPAFDRLFELAIPIAFTFAVVLYRFLDIDVIIRRGLIYSFLAGVIVTIYLLIAVFAGSAIRNWFPSATPYVPFAAAAVAFSLFSPTRRAIARWVDRTFFRIRYDNAQALRALREMVRDAPSRRDVADLLRRVLGGSIEPKRICVSLDEEDGPSAGSCGISPDSIHAAADCSHTLTRPLATPNATALPEIESADYPPPLAAAGFVILAPIVEEGRSIGFILIGEKRSERRYVREDCDLITGAAAIAAAACDRIDLVRRAADEEAARRRLEEMNRLKTDFLSRVAHDLRTPLASICWSSQNLIDGVLGAPPERHVTPLRSIKTSADQLNRLVTNLLEATRREIALQETPIEPTELAACAREAILSLTPIGAARGIRISFETDATPVPPIRGNKAKVMEILNNLIENACKYSPEGSTVEVAVRRADFFARLTVRDHGPGFAEGEAETLFERFRQGKPSPYAEAAGFGLGLYVVRTLITFMQGTVAARNHAEGGAEFVCTFRLWRVTAGDADNGSAIARSEVQANGENR